MTRAAAGRALLLGVAMSVAACGRLYHVEATPRQGAFLAPVPVQVQAAGRDSVDLIIPLAREDGEEQVFGCFLPRDRFISPPAGGAPTRSVRTPQGRQVFVVRTRSDSLGTLLRHGFAVAPRDSLLPELGLADSVLIRLRGDTVVAASCQRHGLIQDREYQFTVDSVSQARAVGAGVAVILFVLLVFAGGDS